MALKPANQPIRWTKRIGILALGLSANAAMSKGYDYVVYPYLMLAFGPVFGWLYAVLGSVILCLGTLWFYDVTKQDWLGIEAAKLLRDELPKRRARAFLHGLLNKGDAVTLLFLSCKYDPFIATVYMRRGSGNHAMSARDWKIFWVSVVVSNAWWGALVFGAIEVFKKWLAPYVPASPLNLF